MAVRNAEQTESRPAVVKNAEWKFRIEKGEGCSYSPLSVKYIFGTFGLFLVRIVSWGSLKIIKIDNNGSSRIYFCLYEL